MRRHGCTMSDAGRSAWTASTKTSIIGSKNRSPSTVIAIRPPWRSSDQKDQQTGHVVDEEHTQHAEQHVHRTRFDVERGHVAGPHLDVVGARGTDALLGDLEHLRREV